MPWWRPFREPPADDGGDMAAARERMVRDQIERRGLTDPELLRAFRTVPRDLFVDSPFPYGDQALPIEEGQTISQPFIVAYMTDAGRPVRPDGWRGARALDVGTGSGYQAAILAELGAEVTSIERYPELSARAGEALRRAGYADVRLVVGDGTRGVPEHAPYDAIIVGAAGPSVPEPLLAQLAPDGGKLVIPVGTREHQQLTVVQRRGEEHVSKTREAVVFVPLIGDHGFRG
ncbi:MAG TPA: protein-L-isoaspartate(D-aspartate) O-methyltransferase [Methylomirabilota bacterium]